MKSSKTVLFMVCSGLGQIQRGFETFTQECFDSLKAEPSLDVFLFKGGGESSSRVKKLWNLARFAKVTQILASILKRDTYWLEQASFTANLLPYVLREQPDLIYFSDGTVGNLLWHWRNLTKQKYKLLFSNGGPLSPPFHRWDHVHQVAPYHQEVAITAGEDIAKQSCIPYGIDICKEIKILSPLENNAVRVRLELPTNRKIVLSVGAINKGHKRMDYVIREVAALPEPRPFLLLLGQQESESREINELGNQVLGADHFAIRTVAAGEITYYYQIADLFVLASLHEGFGRVFLEAMAQGLPCLAHDYEVTRFILGDEGYYGDFRKGQALTHLLSTVLPESNDKSKQYTRHTSVYQRFSWEILQSAYIEMIRTAATQN